MLPRAGPSGKEAASQQARTWLLPDAASCRHLAFATPLAGEPASSTYAHRRGPSSVVTRAFVAALGWSDRQGRLVRLRSARRQRPCGCPRSSPPDSRRTVSASVLLAGPRFSSGTTGPRAAMETPSHAARDRDRRPEQDVSQGLLCAGRGPGGALNVAIDRTKPSEPDRFPYGRCRIRTSPLGPGARRGTASIPCPHLAQVRAQEQADADEAEHKQTATGHQLGVPLPAHGVVVARERAGDRCRHPHDSQAR